MPYRHDSRPSGGPNARGGAGEVYYGAEQTMDVPAPKASITVPAAPANEDTRYYVFDHLGTARVVMNQAGTVVERHDFTPFGVEIMPYQNTADNSHQYTGQERDAATQMDYMHFRYYGSNLGRFMKPDNVVAYAEYPQDWNLYSYALGNPVNLIDPTGHTPDDPLEDYDASHENSPDDLPSDRSDYDYWSQANRALYMIHYMEANWKSWATRQVQEWILGYYGYWTLPSTVTWDEKTQTMTVTAHGYWAPTPWAGSDNSPGMKIRRAIGGIILGQYADYLGAPKLLTAPWNAFLGGDYSIYGDTFPWLDVLRDDAAASSGGVALYTAATGTVGVFTIGGFGLVVVATAGGYGAGHLMNAALPESVKEGIGNYLLNPPYTPIPPDAMLLGR